MERRLLGLDFESYYDSQTFTLRKMDIPSYILDPRFEETCVAVKIMDEPEFLVDAPDIPKLWPWLGDPLKWILYGHNLPFDASICSWRWNWRAAMMICTLAIARILWAKDLKSLALGSVSKHLGLPDKGTTIVRVDGMRRQDIINNGLWPEYKTYALRDIANTKMILDIGMAQIPPEELMIADIILRMTTEPKLRLNPRKLQAYLTEEIEEKQRLLAFAMVGSGMNGVEDLMSNEKFAEVLIALGVDPPRKFSLATKKMTWAFAKSDPGMQELLEHEDPVVGIVTEARIAHKSTIGESRAARFLNIASLNFGPYGTGVCPVPLKVGGAHTMRVSGDWKLNLQNLERNSEYKGPSKMRASLEAPEGHTIVTCDAKQIQARQTAVWSGQWDLVKQFRDKLDPYAIMASKAFTCTLLQVTKPQRFVGKQCVLSGMFGVGPDRWRLNTIYQAREQSGLDLTEMLTPAESERIIYTYRSETQAITDRRNYLQKYCIPMMAREDCNFSVGPVIFRYQEVILPGGLKLYYKDLHWDTASEEWLFTYQGRVKRLYGGKLMENIIQFLERCTVMQAALRIQPQLGLIGCKLDLQGHDELLTCVPHEYVDWTKDLMGREMGRQLEWMPECPVDVEIGSGPNYGEAK